LKEELLQYKMFSIWIFFKKNVSCDGKLNLLLKKHFLFLSILKIA